jgi:uncharacterized protein (TIGR02266 family)
MGYSSAGEAREARELLGKALEALQQEAGVPEEVLRLTQNVAKSIGALFEAEYASTEPDGKTCVKSALGTLSQTLALLQDVKSDHSAVQTTTESIADVISILFPLTTKPTVRPTRGSERPASVRPASARPAASEAPSSQAPASERPASEAPASEPPASQRPASEAPASEPPASEPPVEERAESQLPAGERPASQAPASERPASQAPLSESPASAPPSQRPPASAPPSQRPPASAPPSQRPSGSAPPPNVSPSARALASRPPSARPRSGMPGPLPSSLLPPPAPIPTGERLSLEANLGATTQSNFYVGFSGEIAHGGVFLATYEALAKDTSVRMLVTLPGGFEFECDGYVRFVRDPMDFASESEPGMGIQFENLSDEARNLVVRFIRKRPPIFYDV